MCPRISPHMIKQNNILHRPRSTSKLGECKRLYHFLYQGVIEDNLKYPSISAKKAWTHQSCKLGKENKWIINMDTKTTQLSDERAVLSSTCQDNGTSVETSTQSEVSPEESEPSTVQKPATTESISDLKEREANVVKLTTKDLEDLEKIQEELDSLTSYLPSNLQASNSAIHMKTDTLIDDQDNTTVPLEPNLSVGTRNVNTDSAKVTSMVSDNIPVINNVISLSSTTMSPTAGNTSGTSSEQHSISSGTCGIKTLKLAPKPAASTSVVIQTSSSSIDGSVVTTQPITHTCVVSGLASAYKNETISGLQRLQQPHASTVTPLLGHLTTVKGSDVKVILPQTSNPTQATLVSVPQLGTNNSMQSGLKRTTCSTLANQVITKVIITSNPASNQSAVAPIAGPLSATGTGTLITNDNLGQQSTILLASPTKFTASKPIVNTTGTPRIIRSVPSTPPKQGVVVLSRMKPGKMPSPVSFVKSPQRIAPAPNTGSYSSIISGSKVTIVTATAAVSTPTLSTSITKPLTIPTSPTKVILKPVVQTMKPPSGVVANQSNTTVSNIDTSLKQMLPVAGSTVQQIQVPGSKFHYVRLVTAPASQSGSTQGTKQATLIPVTRPSSTSCQESSSIASVVNVSSGAAVRLTLPITPMLSPQAQVASKPTSTPQRMLIPASNVTSVSQVRTSNSIPAMALRQLPTGTLLQAGSGILMVPAQYNIAQLQQPSQSQSNTIAPAPMVIQSVQPQNILPSPTPGNTSSSSNSSSNSVQQTNFVPVAPATANQLFEQSSSQNLLSSLPRHHINGRSAEVGESRLRKPCNCTKSQCLKLYCDCFANGEFCNHCNCNNCSNNLKHEEERQKAIKACLDRNPLAFHPKIGKGRDGVHERRHTKGCNCKRSGCLKNYCECYEAKILCTNLCKCIGCKNFEDSSERKTLMHLADAAEVRVQQQTAAKTKISSQIQDLPTRPPIISTTGERLPFAFVTQDVVEATCQCLLAQSEDGEKSKMPVSTLERLVLEEFGRCLMQIIEYANRTKVSNT